MTLWLLIVFSALCAFVFRGLPFVFKNSAALSQTEGSLYRFISYSAQAMLGIIVYDTAFDKRDALSLVHEFQTLDGVKLVLLSLAFVVVIKTKRMLLSFFASLLAYLAALLYLH
jgi:branched-subunit amino acid transport protein